MSKRKNGSEFELGDLYMTCGIGARTEEDSDLTEFIGECLVRYRQCDWGDTCNEDKKANDRAVKVGERILAVYTYPKTGEKIWIITEWDRSYTTVLFPDEY